MIELARANPAFRPVIERALIGKPEAILLVEFAGEEREDAAARPQAPGRADGRSRPAGQRGRDARARPAGRAVGSAQGRPQHHDVDEGRRKAGLLHRGLRGAARASGRLHAAPHRRLRQARHAAAPGTRMPRSAPCMCGRSSTCAARAPPRCGRSPRKPRRMVREYKGAYSGEHGDGLVRSEWVGWQFGPRLTKAFETIKDAVRSARTGSIPARSCGRTKMDDRALFRFKPGYDGDRLQAGARLVGVERPERSADRGADRAGQRRRSERRLRQGRRDVQQQRPLPEVRRRHDVPVLPRDARRGASDAWPRQYAAPRAFGPARRGCADIGRRGQGDGSLRELQGLQARLPDRRRHGAHEDRGEVGAAHEQGPQPARPADRQPAGDTRPGRGGCRGCSTSRSSFQPYLGFAKQRSLPKWRGDTFLATTDVDAKRRHGGDLRRHLLQQLRARDPALPRGACSRRPAIASRSPGRPRRARRCAAGAPIWRPARSTRRKDEAKRLLEALLPFVARGVPVVGLEPSCLFTLRDEYLAMGARRAGAQNSPTTPSCSRNSWCARRRPAGWRCTLKALPAEDGAAARPLPPEGVRRDRAPCRRRWRWCPDLASA